MNKSLQPPSPAVETDSSSGNSDDSCVCKQLLHLQKKTKQNVKK